MPLDMAKYLGLYLTEAGEHVIRFSDDLVQLEKASHDPAVAKAPIVDDMFRHAHSVKGMSASMGFEGIAVLAHKVEDLVDRMRGRPDAIKPEELDLLFSAADAMQAMVKSAGGDEIPPADPALIAKLAALSGGGEPQATNPEAIAPPVPAAVPVAAPAATEPLPAAPAKGNRRRLEVEVEISGTCPVPGVRGFLVIKKLGALGSVASSTPTVEDLKAGRIPGKKLVALLDTVEPAQLVEKTLSQVSDLSKVSIRDGGEASPISAAAPAVVAAPAVSEKPPAPAAQDSRTVRVKTELLDYFLDTVGELILATARLREVGRTLPQQHRPPLDEGVDRLHAIVKDLHDKVMAVRMTPLALVTDRLPRIARDISRKVNKQVDVEIRGAEIELDRAILEELGDPLLHVLRNCIDHGLEPAHLRQLAGKPATGRIAITARRERDRVLVDISDDGRGMDPEKLKAAAVRRAAITAEQAASLTDKEALMLCCLPGVSTADTVTDVSGRGVGMDAVKRAVEIVGGTLDIDSVSGQGTRFTFRLPLTVAVQQVLLVRVKDDIFGLPIAKVLGAAEVELAKLSHSRGAPLFSYDGGLVPVHLLGQLLGFDEAVPKAICAVVVVEGEGGRVALAVDGLLGQQEAVLKPLARPLDLVSGLSAVTVLGNGRPVFILDVPRLLAA